MKDGKPCRPDWSKLAKLRGEQKFRAVETHFADELAALDDEARERRLEELKVAWDTVPDLPVKSFLDLTVDGKGEDIFEDQAEAERIVCEAGLFSLRDFEAGDAAIISQMPPRQKKRLLEEALLQRTGERKRQKLISGAEAKTLETLGRETRKKIREADYRDQRRALRTLADEVGLDEARCRA